jgi:VanZ family protein
MTDAEQQRKPAAALLMLSVSIGLLLLLHFYHPAPSGLWLKSLLESLHAPVFGVVALSIFVSTGLRSDWSLGRRLVTAFAASVALGVLSEAAQIAGSRDASLEDLISDWLGAGATLLIAVAFVSRNDLRRVTRYGLASAGLALFLVALWRFIGVSAAYAERNFQQPVLVSFDARFGQAFRYIQHATLQLQPDQLTGRTIGVITLAEGAWPGLIFNDIWPDWREHSALVVEFGLGGNTPLEINVRVHDRTHKLGDQPFGDRFNLSYELQPGRHALRIPLEEIRNAPKGRQMDLSQIEGIVVFCSANHVGRQFQLFEIRLE